MQRYTLKLDTQHNLVPESFKSGGMELAHIESQPFALLSLVIVDNMNELRPGDFTSMLSEAGYETLFGCNQVLLHMMDNTVSGLQNDNENASAKAMLLASHINTDDPEFKQFVKDIREDLAEVYAVFVRDLQSLGQAMQLTINFSESLDVLCDSYLNHLIAELYVREGLR